jgi:RNA polymerase sigma-70 factor (ECF subfamily)
MEILVDSSPITASELFQVYGPKLLALARRQLSTKLSRRVDPEDILQSVFRSFFTHEDQSDRSAAELWSYLTQITLNKVRRIGRRHSAQKRSLAAEDHLFLTTDLNDRQPTSCDVVIMCEELAWLQRQLEPAQRQCLELRLQGCDTAAIAAACQTTDRTIRRWLRGIGELLQFRQAHSATRQHDQPRPDPPEVHWPAGLRVCHYNEFVLEQLIGAGSMCKAFRARRVDLGERVCLKILRQAWRDHPEYRQQLLDEAAFLHSVYHPAIVSLLGAGQMPNGALYLVLRWIEGESLGSYMKVNTSVQAAAKLQQMAMLLKELHGQGITHGDLHSGNVLVSQDGKLWFTDFRPASQGLSAAVLEQRIQADWEAFNRMRL